MAPTLDAVWLADLLPSRCPSEPIMPSDSAESDSREYAHVIGKHMLIDHREKRATASLLAAAGLAGSMSQAGSAANLLLKAGSASSMAGFSHLCEVESDRIGLEMMDAAGYKRV